MPSPTIDTILFDLDGTLVDTELAAAQAISDSFKAWHIQIDPTDADYITGRTWEATAEFFAKKYPLPLSPAEATQQMVLTYRNVLHTHLTIVPGGAEAVRSLVREGFKIGLVTGSHRLDAIWCLDHLKVREYFEVVLGAEDYPRGKPAPDGYVKAMKLLGDRDPKRTLVFEDSQPGIASAIAAGAWVVAISGTNHFNQDTSHAHCHIEDLTPVNAQWVRDLAKQLMTK